MGQHQTYRVEVGPGRAVVVYYPSTDPDDDGTGVAVLPMAGVLCDILAELMRAIEAGARTVEELDGFKLAGIAELSQDQVRYVVEELTSMAAPHVATSARFTVDGGLKVSAAGATWTRPLGTVTR